MCACYVCGVFDGVEDMKVGGTGETAKTEYPRPDLGIAPPHKPKGWVT